MQPPILVVCDDLFFWARIADAARARGREAVRVGSEPAMESAWARGGFALVLADLGARSLDVHAWAGRFKALADPPRLVGFGSHVDVDAQARARAAGFDLVLPRSRFHRELEAIVAG